MESFWAILKSEMYYLNRFDTYDELDNAVDEYIYYYNFEWLQQKLNCMSPMEFRNTLI